jgi:hypothetical protein
VSRGSQILIVVLLIPAAVALVATLRYPGKAPLKLSASSCDSALWQHVYEKERLQVIEPCTAVDGRVIKLNGSSDGDLHISLDPDNKAVLNFMNLVHGHGHLVVEVVCLYAPAVREDAKTACADFHPQVMIPKVGDRIRVIGAYVTDTDNGWNEIHPVTKIDLLP